VGGRKQEVGRAWRKHEGERRRKGVRERILGDAIGTETIAFICVV